MHDTDGAVAEWAQWAQALCWEKPFHTAFDPSTPAGRWFLGGRLNVSVNCLDRHLPGRGDVPAIHWEGEPPDERRTITYGDLHAEVVAFTRALRDLGVGVGDRVALYMSWVPETVVAMLACARIGAVHAVLPAALPADALADRLIDLEPKAIVTQDGAWRRGTILPLKRHCDEALPAVASIEQTIVVQRMGIDIDWFEGDRWYEELVGPYRGRVSPEVVDDLGRPEPVEADHPLAIMYIASSRGRPTGIVHRSAGLLASAAMLHDRASVSSPTDIVWCAVELSWVGGQTHGVYGPLACGATTVMFEGALDTPTHERPWQIVQRYGVNALLTTPSVIRNLRSWVDCPPGERGRSIRRIVAGGEPLDPETREWLAREIGHQASIVKTWAQTELGGIALMAPRPPGLPYACPDVVDAEGRSVPPGEEGELVLDHPWPALFLGHHRGGDIVFDPDWGSATRYRTGDMARRDPDGRVTILGHIDPIITVSSQLVSATEIAEVLEEHPFVLTAEVIDRPDQRRGHAVVACVVLESGVAASGAIAAELRDHVHDTLGGLATPRAFAFCEDLPYGVPRDTLRRSLWALCAEHPSPSFQLSAAQIQTAVAAAHSNVS